MGTVSYYFDLEVMEKYVFPFLSLIQLKKSMYNCEIKQNVPAIF